MGGEIRPKFGLEPEIPMGFFYLFEPEYLK